MAAATKKAVATGPANADGMPVEPGVESWVNVGSAMVHLIKIGEYGRRETELVYGGRTFAITPQERRLNQSQVFDPAKNDPFTNGSFKPLVLLDDEKDTAILRANPNVLDDDAIAELFKVTGEAFSQRLLAITNPNTIDRLIETARKPDTGASVQQVHILERYKKLLTGEKDEPAPESGPEGLPKAVTPR
jgi:hypothetical protein